MTLFVSRDETALDWPCNSQFSGCSFHCNSYLLMPSNGLNSTVISTCIEIGTETWTSHLFWRHHPSQKERKQQTVSAWIRMPIGRTTQQGTQNLSVSLPTTYPLCLCMSPQILSSGKVGVIGLEPCGQAPSNESIHVLKCNHGSLQKRTGRARGKREKAHRRNTTLLCASLLWIQ